MDNYKPAIVKWVENMFDHSFAKKWYKTYWAFDIHGTILKPHNKTNRLAMDYYPLAKETLQYLSKRADIVMFLWTSSHPDEIEYYIKNFKKHGINFQFINKNPDISESDGAFGHYADKPYYNVLFDDKAGFFPETDWEPFQKYIINENIEPDISWLK